MRDPTDARPLVDTGADPTVHGWRCVACGYTTASPMPRCPLCHDQLQDAQFSGGSVWSATVVRIPVGDRVPPYNVAYIDLDDGPRVLAHVSGSTDTPVPIGARVTVVGTTLEGDVEVRQS